MFQIITLYLTLVNIKERVIDIAAKKIKQAEMAEMLGINQSQISLLRIMQVSMAGIIYGIFSAPVSLFGYRNIESLYDDIL